MNFSPWDEDAARDALARYLVKAMGDPAAVFAVYVAPDGGRALIDRELYLPEKWTGDRDRYRKAEIGDGTAFAAKPELARVVIARARQAC